MKNVHRRLNPLTGEWVLVSPHRTERPWQGAVEGTHPAAALEYDPNCYLCPGNERAHGARNPPYGGTFVFDNDFAALLPDVGKAQEVPAPFLRAREEPGTCRVLCFTPRHDLTFASMSQVQIEAVVDTWAAQFRELGAQSGITWVQIFENRGAMMGASNPHPHGQIWASASLPNEGVKELREQRAYQAAHGSCLLCDYLDYELRDGSRLVFSNASFAIVVPFWAIWPFEVLLLPRRHIAAIDALSAAERSALAQAVGWLGRCYDALFNTPFPYSMGWHNSPTDGDAHGEWHLHAHYYPPLLRSASIRKFMVGYELLAQPQRDITAEEAAARLRTAASSALDSRS